jgi:hypothetical protein
MHILFTSLDYSLAFLPEGGWPFHDILALAPVYFQKAWSLYNCEKIVRMLAFGATCSFEVTIYSLHRSWNRECSTVIQTSPFFIYSSFLSLVHSLSACSLCISSRLSYTLPCQYVSPCHYLVESKPHRITYRLFSIVEMEEAKLKTPTLAHINGYQQIKSTALLEHLAHI